ncbi:CMP-N-acetylneuraminate-beta-galactosamide-alpha-2,3-sialyltransferase 1 [Triplophysa rosa]|uniref:CMP-N-acetylneuraminate-beta-galactosamide-alpha-2,3-sialyltransferase 1 n=1 Tax=Triplophysa rosa TaxID=992332 RepID=A0A9W7TJT1_TRIRA|nr:CMP-N-acetylneuraminate-beta-galactosamide-alpha-2,3-sialyltransferase 1 [Triplophysa rosa]KAI7798597.1 alpha-2 [Triplophysa rosa]
MAIVLRTLRHHHRYLTFLLSSTIVLFCFHFQNSVVIFTYNSYFRYVSEPAPCACATCALDRGRADGFSARYEPTVHLLLNSSNSELRADVFGWWKGLQNVTSVANYTSVVKNLFPLFSDKEHYSDAGPDRCRTCAVVGNSGNLLRSHYGPLIDSNDFVVRINKGPTGGFEKDVGSRTTHRIMYPESSVDVDNSTHLVLSPFKMLDIEWLISAFTTKNITKTYMNVSSTIQANKDKVMILHPEFMKYVYVNWTDSHGRYPSTGFLTLMFALHICDEVNVFGFGATKAGQWHHYFDETLTLYVNESHAGDFEYQTILRLEQEKRIVMFKGWT